MVSPLEFAGLLGFVISRPRLVEDEKYVRVMSEWSAYVEPREKEEWLVGCQKEREGAYGVFSRVPANPPMEPAMKLFISCDSGVYSCG